MQDCGPSRAVREWTADEIARDCFCSALQRFIRENFGLYSPPGDYRALRLENLKRASAAANRASLRPA